MPPASAASRYATAWSRAASTAMRPPRLPPIPPATRKLIQSPAEVLAAHRQLAAEFGNQADKVVAEARERASERMQAAQSRELRNGSPARP